MMEDWQFGPAQELRRRYILDDARLGPIHWYCPGKSAAVVVSIDDIFPGTSQSAYEAGGDLEKGALGLVLWLLERHPQLQLTFFVTPDWRRISAAPHRFWRHVPWLRDRVHLADVLPKGSMDIRNHPEFVAFLNAMPRTEVALHGLHHINLGQSVSVEFEHRDRAKCAAMLAEALQIFDESGLRYVRGLQPPGWACSLALQQACRDVGIEWVMSARDIQTPVSRGAKANMSGLAGVSLLFPERIAEGLLHVSTNFQATSAPERAFDILDAGGILSIKAHITKSVPGHIHLDGVDQLYMNYLDRLFGDIEQRYGDTIEWTTLGRLGTSLSASSTTSFVEESPAKAATSQAA
jgi:peptidoglycan/xylan/chitin deacetylase (PgdA/CDA1 family)